MACGRTIRKAFALGLVFLAVAFAGPASFAAGLIKGDLTVDLSGGYARLLFAMSDDVDASVHTSGNVLIISFAQPVQVSVDRLTEKAPDYIGAARRDPDGRAVRIALAGKVSVNSMAAGEKFFVDLLPDTWSGPPPGLPQQVVEELARRARQADRLERIEQQKAQRKKLPPVRVHVAVQPTFVRFVFDVPDQTEVSADRAKERLTLTFDAPIPFDLADAEAAMPAAVAAINTEVEQDSALVRFSFLSKVDVRTFRDGNGYVVDIVGGTDAKSEMRGENGGKGRAPDDGFFEKAAVEAAKLRAAAEGPMKPEDPPSVAAPETAPPATAMPSASEMKPAQAAPAAAMPSATAMKPTQAAPATAMPSAPEMKPTSRSGNSNAFSAGDEAHASRSGISNAFSAGDEAHASSSGISNAFSAGDEAPANPGRGCTGENARVSPVGSSGDKACAGPGRSCTADGA